MDEDQEDLRIVVVVPHCIAFHGTGRQTLVTEEHIASSYVVDRTGQEVPLLSCAEIKLPAPLREAAVFESALIVQGVRTVLSVDAWEDPIKALPDLKRKAHILARGQRPSELEVRWWANELVSHLSANPAISLYVHINGFHSVLSAALRDGGIQAQLLQDKIRREVFLALAGYARDALPLKEIFTPGFVLQLQYNAIDALGWRSSEHIGLRPEDFGLTSRITSKDSTVDVTIRSEFQRLWNSKVNQKVQELLDIVGITMKYEFSE